LLDFTQCFIHEIIHLTQNKFMESMFEDLLKFVPDKKCRKAFRTMADEAIENQAQQLSYYIAREFYGMHNYKDGHIVDDTDLMKILTERAGF
jgi:hypothetical protein